MSTANPSEDRFLRPCPLCEEELTLDVLYAGECPGCGADLDEMSAAIEEGPDA